MIKDILFIIIHGIASTAKVISLQQKLKYYWLYIIKYSYTMVP